jgi:hypothetical protein
LSHLLHQLTPLSLNMTHKIQQQHYENYPKSTINPSPPYKF